MAPMTPPNTDGTFGSVYGARFALVFLAAMASCIVWVMALLWLREPDEKSAQPAQEQEPLDEKQRLVQSIAELEIALREAQQYHTKLDEAKKAVKRTGARAPLELVTACEKAKTLVKKLEQELSIKRSLQTAMNVGPKVDKQATYFLPKIAAEQEVRQIVGLGTETRDGNP